MRFLNVVSFKNIEKVFFIDANQENYVSLINMGILMNLGSMRNIDCVLWTYIFCMGGIKKNGDIFLLMGESVTKRGERFDNKNHNIYLFLYDYIDE